MPHSSSAPWRRHDAARGSSRPRHRPRARLCSPRRGPRHTLNTNLTPICDARFVRPASPPARASPPRSFVVSPRGSAPTPAWRLRQDKEEPLERKKKKVVGKIREQEADLHREAERTSGRRHRCDAEAGSGKRSDGHEDFVMQNRKKRIRIDENELEVDKYERVRRRYMDVGAGTGRRNAPREAFTEREESAEHEQGIKQDLDKHDGKEGDAQGVMPMQVQAALATGRRRRDDVDVATTGRRNDLHDASAWKKESEDDEQDVDKRSDFERGGFDGEESGSSAGAEDEGEEDAGAVSRASADEAHTADASEQVVVAMIMSLYKVFRLPARRQLIGALERLHVVRPPAVAAVPASSSSSSVAPPCASAGSSKGLAMQSAAAGCDSSFATAV
mmetsp:Transcript_28560/g.76299  ORF Transcript_28560/g.76299 Transcript_28560/m.76299 type:complete len:389 (+) Transcript_28560:58-1224(+)